MDINVVTSMLENVELPFRAMLVIDGEGDSLELRKAACPQSLSWMNSKGKVSTSRSIRLLGMR